MRSSSPFVVAAVVGALCAGLLALPAPASAREPNGKAKRFDKLGKKAYGKKDWDEAIAAFEAAYQADPMPKFLFNTARAYEKKSDHRKAIEYLEKYLAKVTDPKEREDASDRLSILQIKLRKTKSPVKISAPAGALITAKGAEETVQAKGTLSSWLPFGAYEVSVSLKGFTDATRTVVVKADDNVKMDITLDKIPDKPPPAPVVKKEPPPKPPPKDEAPKEEVPAVAKKPDPPKAADPPEKADEPAGGPPAWLAYTAMGLGGLALVGGAVAGVFSNQAHDNIEALAKRSKEGEAIELTELQTQIDARDNNALAANVLYGVGIVAAGTGVVLWLMAPDDAVALPAVTPTTDGGVLTWSGTF